MKKQFITDEERLGSVEFNRLVLEDIRCEREKPINITVYLPSAILDMESIFAPSADIHHPNYRGC